MYELKTSLWHSRQYSLFISALAGMNLPLAVRALLGMKYFSPEAGALADQMRGSCRWKATRITTAAATAAPQLIPIFQRMRGPASRCNK